tara:strand:- start:1213 stop:2466 length:1254 start_codon:yes stop_codon:yes gene_type:complete
VLTKELLCFRIIKNKVLPKLIDTENIKNLELAESLLNIFSKSIGDFRGELEEKTRQVIEEFNGSTRIAKGLEKLLYDRTEFDIEPKEDLIKLRKEVFNCSSRLLNGNLDLDSHFFEFNSNPTLKFYRNQIANTLEQSIEDLKNKIYSDLPPYQKVLRFRDLSSEKLLHRYNCALVQGLLLRCEKMTVCLVNNDSARLRQILKYLRFSKLLAKISIPRKKDKSIVLEVDGPLSMFLNTQKYGFNLAKFFPAILLHPNWELIAEVRIKKNKIHTLKLNQDSGLISHYKQFLAYIPEEIKLLRKKLKEKIPDWKLNPSSDYIHLGGESICFPDYLLDHYSGKKVYIELFHTWHSNPLLYRLEQVRKIEGVTLLIGVDRSLLKKKELFEKINNSNYFKKFGFYFREFPSVSKIRDLLSILL